MIKHDKTIHYHRKGPKNEVPLKSHGLETHFPHVSGTSS